MNIENYEHPVYTYIKYLIQRLNIPYKASRKGGINYESLPFM